MKLTKHSKSILAVRRERRTLVKEGWEEVDLNGGRLWELDRGVRTSKKIVDARPSITGKGLWVKIA